MYKSVKILVEPTTVYVDNEGCIDLDQNGVMNKRTNHIDIRFHFTRKSLKDRSIKLQYFPTESMVADMLTKPLGRVKLEKLRSDSGLTSLKL